MFRLWEGRGEGEEGGGLQILLVWFCCGGMVEVEVLVHVWLTTLVLHGEGLGTMLGMFVFFSGYDIICGITMNIRVRDGIGS